MQQAIGRIQPFDITQACVADLREAGIRSLITDPGAGAKTVAQSRFMLITVQPSAFA